jgi:ABC-type phosphate transport system auxiliary subunit
MGINTVTTVLLGFLSLAWIGDFVRGMFQRRKVQADSNLSDANAVQVIVGSAAAVVAPLKTRVEELQKDLAEAKTEVDKLIVQLQKATAENQKVTLENQRITTENQRITAENRQLRIMLAGGTS